MLMMLYQIATTLALPFTYLYLLYRRYKGKEELQRFNERFGFPSVSRPEGKLVWIHAASVGESLSIIPLVERLKKEHPQFSILVTTGTVSSAKIMATKLPSDVTHQFIPVDSWPCVYMFLKHWKPNLTLWVESELWPCLLAQTAKQSPVVLVNARMSDKSYDRWLRFKPVIHEMLRCFTWVLAQSKQDAQRYKMLGARYVDCVGNLKYDAQPLVADPKKLAELLALIGQRPLWLAASTHADEEAQIAKVHLSLKQSYPDMLTIIVPRHPNRAEEIIQSMPPEITILRRSVGELPGATTDIYLADTMGELGIFYRLAPVVFIGGTLVPHGGQNPLEPARLDSAIVYGPHMENFMEIKQDFERQKAAICVANSQELGNVLTTLITDHQQQQLLSQAATVVVQEKSGVMDRLYARILPFLQ